MNPASVKNTTNKIFSVYPNPVSDRMMISSAGMNTLMMTDVTGKQIFGKVFEANTVVDMTAFVPGTYYLTVQNEKGEKCVERIVKQ
jgi:hypothetical protein